MAQGSRGCFALLGAGMLFCTGLVGCMDNDPKPTKALPKAGTQTGIPGSSVKTGPGTTYERGPLPLGYNAPSGRTSTTTGAVGGTNTFGTPSVPGATGTGTSMAPGGSSAIPPITPPSGTSNYQGSVAPQSMVGGGASANAGLNGSAAMPTNPPTLGYDVPMPPTPSAGAGYPAVSPTYPMSPMYPSK